MRNKTYYVIPCCRADSGMEIQMKKIVSLLLTAALLIGSLMVLTSCDEETGKGAKINVYLGAEVFDFDPTDYYVDSNADQVMSLLYEPLFKLDKNGEVQCAGAKSYSVDTVTRTISVKLRNTYWSDEVRVKAEDYIYAWREVLLDPNSPNPAAALLYDIENAIAIKAGDASYSTLGVSAKGLYELTITYREGADYEQLLKNLAATATTALRQDVVSAAKSHWSKDMSTIVTNGPFKIAALDRTAGEFTLSRNPGFHQNPSSKNYTANVTPDSLVSFLAVDGELNVSYDDIECKTIFFIGDASLAVRTAERENAKVYDDLSTYSYLFNTDKAIFKNANVRYALSIAIDRAAIEKAVVFAKAATGFLPDPIAETLYGNEVPERILLDYNSNLAEAKELIAAANIPEEEMAFTLTINNDEESIAMATIAKRCWASLGFNVTVEPVSSIQSTIKDTLTDESHKIEDSAIQTLMKEASYGNRQFDVIGFDWQMYSTDAIVALSAFTSTMNGNGMNAQTSTTRANVAGWTSAEYDQYINAAYKATGEERTNALIEAEKILIESGVIAPVVYNQTFAFVGSDLSSLTVDGFGNFVFTKVSLKNYEYYLPKKDEK